MVDKRIFCILGLFLFAVFTVSFASAAPAIISAYVNDTDYFYTNSVNNENITIVANVTNTSAFVISFANFSTFTIACGTKGAVDFVPMVVNRINATTSANFMKASCNLSSVAANPGNFTNGPFTGGNITLVFVEQADPPHPAIDNSLFAVIYNMTTPPQMPPGCQRFGTSTTDFSRVLDFNRVNFVVHIQNNFSCMVAQQGAPSPPGLSADYLDVMKMNLTSVNLSTPEQAQLLSQLNTALSLSIPRPKTFGITRIFVNTSVFAALNTNATIQLFNLPFTAQPNISADNSTELLGASWVSNGFVNGFRVLTGNLTINVSGFSGYNASDIVAPNITINSPAGVNISSTTPNVIFSVIVNGTGTEPSYVQITNISGGASYAYNGSLDSTTNSANCVGFTANNETYNCTVVFPVSGLQEGANTIIVTAYDYGGSAGNTNTGTRAFVVDRIGPVINVSSPGASSYTNATSVLFNVSAVDASTRASACWVYVNASVYTMTNSTSGFFNYTNSSIAAGVWNVTYYCNDTLGNNANTTYTFTVDRTAPASLNVTTGTPGSSGVTIYFTSNEQIYSLNLSYGADSSFSSSTMSTGINAASSSGSITGLSASTTYYFNATVCDMTGNNCLTNGTYSFTTAAGSSGGSTDGGTGGTTANNALSYWYATYSFDGDKFKAGFNWDLQNHYRLKVPVDGESHYVGVVGLTNTSVTVNVTSTPQQAILSIGQFKKFDVNDDYVYDMIVTLNSITGNRANLAIKALNETMTAQEKAAVLAAKTVTNATGVQNLTTTGAGAGETGGSNWLLWTVLVIVVLLVAAGVVYYFYLRKMKNLGYK